MANPKLNNEASHSKIAVEYKFRATPFSVRGHITQVLDDLSDHLPYPQTRPSLELVMAELLNNIVEHSYAGNPRGYIFLQVTLDADDIFIKTSDTGIPMPDLLLPDPSSPDLDVSRIHLPEGHFGWLMIRELCCDLQYMRTNATNHFSLKLND
ncbi:MAG: ATP-binding protein [Litoreibacter sp.]